MIDLGVIKNFTLDTTDGSVFDYYKYQQQSWSLIVFYRGEWCGACRQQLITLQNSHKWFSKRDIHIIAIGADDQLFTSVLINTLEIDFPILSDSQGVVFSKFHLDTPRDHKKIKPALFLIDPQHVVRYAYIGQNYSDRPRIVQLQEVIQKIQNNS